MSRPNSRSPAADAWSASNTEGKAAHSSPRSLQWMGWPTTRCFAQRCVIITSRRSTAARPASTTSSSRSPAGGCHDPARQRAAAGADTSSPTEVPARRRLLRTDLAGGATADGANPASGRRTLRLVGRCVGHRLLLRRGHGVLREAGAHARCRHRHTAAVRGVSGRETDSAGVDLAGGGVRCRHRQRQLRLPSDAAGGRGAAGYYGDAAGGVRHVVAVRLDQQLVSDGEHPAGGAEPADPVLLRRMAEPGVVSAAHAGSAAAARGGVRPGAVGAVAGRVCGGVSGGVRSRIVLGGQGGVRPLRDRQVGGDVMAMSTTVAGQALAAFGRNDLRGSYRDPLLVMIVVAPAIWTTLVAVITPRVTTMLARRSGFDLVPYYPLILTAFLLLTSVIIAGALAAFLVLDELDAGTLTALRVTPVPLAVFFGYRAATVTVVTTVYVITTLTFSGLLEPGLIPALVPIGLLAGLSAVVTLLLILAMANNKIQGLAAVRALGMLTAGLPCLPWFIDSGWNLAFGVLPPFWAAKAFWVASDHGTWWPYILAGTAYNLAIAWPLFRRFHDKTT